MIAMNHVTSADSIYLPLSESLQFFAGTIGGLRRGSICCLAGLPGSCKSVLSTQIALDLAHQGERSLIVATEQTVGDVEERARLATADWPRRHAAAAMDLLSIEPNIYDVRLLPDFLMREVLNPAGRFHGIKLLILDSIQGHGLPAGAIHAYRKVLEAATMAKQNGITTILISHVVKRGEIAGPQLLGHGLDVLVMMRPALTLKYMTIAKNRHGSTSSRPIPLAIAAKALRLIPAPHAKPNPAAAYTFAGVGSGLTQVQASVTLPMATGSAGKLIAPGLPKKEIEQLIDCCSQVRGLDLADLSYSIQCRLPGRMQYLCHFGLPLAIALVASYIRKSVPANAIYLGEVDLFRRVLDLPIDLVQALCSALDAGEVATPVTIFAPPSAVPHLPQSNARVRIEVCSMLEDVIAKTWPDLLLQRSQEK